MRHRILLLVGLALRIAADLLLAAATSPLFTFVGTALSGGHMALTQGLLSGRLTAAGALD